MSPLSVEPDQGFDDGGIVVETMGETPGRLVLPEDTIFQIPAMMHDAIDRQGQGGGPTGRQGPALV